MGSRSDFNAASHPCADTDELGGVATQAVEQRFARSATQRAGRTRRDVDESRFETEFHTELAE